MFSQRTARAASWSVVRIPLLMSTTLIAQRSVSTTRGSFYSAALRATPLRLAPSVSDGAAAPLNAASFAQLTPMVLLQRALEQWAALDGTQVACEIDGKDVNRIVITKKTFDTFCSECHISDPDLALQTLADAAVVVPINGGELVHLRPVQFAEEMDAITTLDTSSATDITMLESLSLPRSFILQQQDKKVAELTAQEEAMRSRLQPAIAKAARWRRSVWGGTLVFAGAQLAIISRLTYFDLDWDIMEPVSYMITIGTALFFYLYYLRHDVEHTYEDFDRRYVTKRVRKYAPSDFDWNAYQTLCSQLDVERATLKLLEDWAKTH